VPASRGAICPSASGTSARFIFAQLEQYRAIDTRHDKTAAIFLGAIHLAATTD